LSQPWAEPYGKKVKKAKTLGQGGIPTLTHFETRGASVQGYEAMKGCISRECGFSERPNILV
jgi:hypothetical protein